MQAKHLAQHAVEGGINGGCKELLEGARQQGRQHLDQVLGVLWAASLRMQAHVCEPSAGSHKPHMQPASRPAYGMCRQRVCTCSVPVHNLNHRSLCLRNKYPPVSEVCDWVQNGGSRISLNATTIINNAINNAISHVNFSKSPSIWWVGRSVILSN